MRVSCSKPVLVSCIVSALLGGARVGRAAPDRFDVQSFHPTPSLTTGYLGTTSTTLLTPGFWEVGYLANYGVDPLVFHDSAGHTLGHLVGAETASDLYAAYGVLDRLEAGLVLPVVLSQHNGVLSTVRDRNDPQAKLGLGDLRLVGRTAILAPSTQTGGLGLALSLAASLPTGDRQTFQGEPVRIEPKLAAEYLLTNDLRVAANLGYRVRSQAEILYLQVDDAVTFDAAVLARAPAQLTPAWLDAWSGVAEVNGAVTLFADHRGAEEVPVELLAGLRAQLGPIVVQLGGGRGISYGAGVPRWRAFLGIGLVGGSERDRDGDGIPDSVDQCPDLVEDFDGFQDEDGCPDLDNDGDGIPDALDRCPNEPEDFDGFEDADGCPDPDNDGDGIPDIIDRCPNVPGIASEQGCPAPQPAPGEPSVQTRKAPSAAAVAMTEVAVYFNSDSTELLAESLEPLRQIVRLLLLHPEVTPVLIEGHADERGDESYNVDLSRRRAELVKTMLVQAGVAAERLRVDGLGSSQPLAAKGSALGRSVNRRVELRLAP